MIFFAIFCDFLRFFWPFFGHFLAIFGHFWPFWGSQNPEKLAIFGQNPGNPQNAQKGPEIVFFRDFWHFFYLFIFRPNSQPKFCYKFYPKNDDFSIYYLILLRIFFILFFLPKMPGGTAFFCEKMAKNGQKWPKRPKMAKKGPKMAKNGRKWPKMAIKSTVL